MAGATEARSNIGLASALRGNPSLVVPKPNAPPATYGRGVLVRNGGDGAILELLIPLGRRFWKSFDRGAALLNYLW